MDNDQTDVIALARMAIGLWIIAFVAPLVVTSVVNGIVGVPLHQIVNTQLSITLIFIGLACVWTAFVALANLFTRDIGGLIAALLLLVIYALQTLSTAGAYLLYANIVGIDLVRKSFVFREYAQSIETLFEVGRHVDWWRTFQGLSTIGSAIGFLGSVTVYFVAKLERA